MKLGVVKTDDFSSTVVPLFSADPQPAGVVIWRDCTLTRGPIGIAVIRGATVSALTHLLDMRYPQSKVKPKDVVCEISPTTVRRESGLRPHSRQ